MLAKRWKRTTGALAGLVLVLAMVAGPLLGSAAQQAGAAAPLKFTILHTNDEHSEIYPYDLALDYPAHPTTGGFSRLAYEIGAIKAAKAAAGEPVLTLSAGDWSQGTLFSLLEMNAAPELSLMYGMGYDAVTIGNHDIELTPGYLALELAAAAGGGVKLPILSANITFSGTAGDNNLKAFYSDTDLQGTQLAIQRYTVKTLSNGLKVGIFGLLGVEAEAVAPGMAPTTFGNVPGLPEDPVSFFNRVTVAQDMVNRLRTTEGCNVVVALSHSGIVEEQNLASMVEGIDVIVGGHSHDLIYPPQMAGTSNTIIVQAGANGEWLGNLELQYDAAAVSPAPKVTVANAQAIHIDQNIPTVPAMDTVINQYLAGINGHLGFDCLSPMAETDIAGNGGFDLLNAPNMAETNLGDLMTDSFRATMKSIYPADPARVGFESNGVIRTALPKGASGRFSFYDLYRTLPLGGSPYDANAPGYPMVSFWLAGAELQGVLSEILDMDNNEFFLQMSGMRYAWNPAGAAGQKLVSLEVENAAGTGWDPVNPAGLYRLVTDYYTGSFLAVFGLKPRFNTGAQYTPTPPDTDYMKPFIVPNFAPPETRVWQALAGYIQAMPDLDSDGLPNIVPTYYSTQARITPQAWFLPEGCTANGFETWVLIQNPNPTVATINIIYMTPNGEIVKPAFGMAPNSRTTVFVNTDVPDTSQVSTRVESDQAIVVERAIYWNGRAGGTESLGEIPWSNTWYLAEGSTANGFETWVLVENPNAATATVTLTYLTGTGKVAKAPFTMPPNSRTSVLVNSDLPDNAHVSTTVTSNIPVAAERACYWSNRKAGHASLGATAPSTTWYLAEGTTADGFEDWLLVQNPGDVDSTVTITYMTGAGEVNKAPLVVPAGHRVSVFVNADVPDNAHVSVAVNATQPVVAERACYWNSRAGGHDSLGAVAPASTWELAEGCTANGFETWLLMQNPNASAVTVTITYMTATGVINRAPLTMAPGTRVSLLVNNDVPDNIQVSTKVESSGGPIVVERSTYWGNRIEGACSIGYAP